jgi:hypothetical protein
MRTRPKHLFLRVAVLVILLIVTVLFSFYIWLAYDMLRIIAIGDKAEAVYYEVDDVSYDPYTNSGGYVNLKYEYVDENGVRYAGTDIRVDYKTAENAEKRLGETVWIYIDGQGNSVLAASDPQPWIFILITAGLLSAAVSVFVFLILLPSRKMKKQIDIQA